MQQLIQLTSKKVDAGVKNISPLPWFMSHESMCGEYKQAGSESSLLFLRAFVPWWQLLLH